jgi:2-polyprenyl-3-methyl-5-hydroxy-6-metoxy-1,4-benzoquinol methylase
MNEQLKSEFEYSGVENLEAMKEAQNYNRFLLNLVRRYLVGNEILDFGAGTGTFAMPLQTTGVTVACVEPDSRLRSHLSSAGLTTHADIAAVAANSIDCSYSMNVLEHVEDDRAALAAIYEKIRPGGRIIIYVPAFDVLYSKMDELVGHYRRYRRKDLVAKMTAANFQIDTATYVDSLGFFSALVYRWLGNNTGVISAGSVKIYDRVVFPLSRILDRIVLGSFGKNLLVVGTRPI